MIHRASLKIQTPARFSAPRGMHPKHDVRVRTDMDAVEQLRAVAETLYDMAPELGGDAREVDRLAEDCDALADTIERFWEERHRPRH